MLTIVIIGKLKICRVILHSLWTRVHTRMAAKANKTMHNYGEMNRDVSIFILCFIIVLYFVF